MEKVVVSAVDENRNPVPGSEMEFDCDTVLLSVGLIPENELNEENILPKAFDPRVAPAVADAVAQAARESGVARV